MPPHHASLRTNLAPGRDVVAVDELPGARPGRDLVEGRALDVAAGVISDWALKTDTRYGKLPLALTRFKVTVGVDRHVEPLSRTPLMPELPAATRRSIVATTSSDVKSVPSCHFTPCGA